MILLVHLLFGAAIGKIIPNAFLAVVLAFLSHFLLDLLPHVEYSAENIEKKQWNKALPDFYKLFLDFFLGILAVYVFSGLKPIIYIAAIFSVLPDFLSSAFSFLPYKICKICNNWHWEKIHFLHDKKISVFWRFFSQLLVVVISIAILF